MAFSQPPVGNPMGVQNQGPPVGNPMGGGNEMAAKQRLMEIAQEAEAIMTQFPHLAEELAGGQPATPMPEMPQMPVQGNTGGLGGNIPPGLLA